MANIISIKSILAQVNKMYQMADTQLEKHIAVGDQNRVEYFMGLSQAYWNVKQMLEISAAENKEDSNEQTRTNRI